MKHYPHHIGDFDRATRHLTRIERSVYRDLIDLYYDTERPLTLDRAALCRRIIANSNEESTAVEQTLNEFFTETPTGWFHERCETEIDAYRANASQRAQAGKASAEAKRLRKLQALNGNSTSVDAPLPCRSNEVLTDGNGESTNREPGTVNRKPDKQPTVVKRASKKCPADFEITEDLRTWAARECPTVDAAKATDKFRDYTFKTATTDWAGAWRNWLRRDAESAPGFGRVVGINKQEALEASNAAVAQRFLRNNGYAAQ